MGVGTRIGYRGSHSAVWICGALLLVLTACKETPTTPASTPGDGQRASAGDASGTAAAQNAKLAYRHDLQLEMPAASVKPRYDRSLERCLQDVHLGCVVLKTSFDSVQQPGRQYPYAMLTVRLTHDAVKPFETDLMTPLPGETVGDAVLLSRSTVAEDLAGKVADVERRQAQLVDYRDRLTLLAQRQDVKVEDLIKIESELSNTQTQLEAISAQKGALNQRIDTETLSVAFGSKVAPSSSFDPIVQSLRHGGRVLSQSTGVAISFLIATLPWLPILALGLFLARWIFRRWRR